jgi:predicted alpha/beta superfamily hydrolase
MPHDVPPAATAFAIPGATQWDMASKITGRTYRVMLFVPPAPPPPGGHPVVIVTDGNLTFPTAAMTALSMIPAGGKPAIVVGIGYPSDDLVTPMMLRTRDLTPVTPLDTIIPQPGLPAPTAENFGGGPDFLRFLLEELRPALDKAHPTNPADYTLYGHSLGGLFTLNALFDQPTAFRTYAISSPSIWWSNRLVLQGEAAFAAAVEGGKVQPRVLITVGETEQDPPAVAPPGFTLDEAAARMAEARMVDNARDLAARLAAVKGATGYLVRTQVFQAEDHMSVIPASLARTLVFALKD